MSTNRLKPSPLRLTSGTNIAVLWCVAACSTTAASSNGVGGAGAGGAGSSGIGVSGAGTSAVGTSAAGASGGSAGGPSNTAGTGGSSGTIDGGAGVAQGGGGIADGGAGSGGVGGGTSGIPKHTASEVLLVVNSGSPISKAIGMDYAQKRGVTQVLSITCADSATSSDRETIAYADYQSTVAAPISQYLASHPAIQFMVLTKGVPIRINGAPTGCCEDSNAKNPVGQPSVDSTLAALDYPQISGAKEIGITGSGTIGKGYLNRYWNMNEPFSHAKFGGYLVTRLDGYTQADAQSLVTRALNAEAQLGSGKVLLDIPPSFGLGDKESEPVPVTGTVTQESSYGSFNGDMLHAHDLLEGSGVPNELAITDPLVGGRSDLLGYFSWGSNDPQFDSGAYESLSFASGSIGDTAVSTSGRTFLPTSGGQSLLADLIGHGLTGGKGYVGEPLLQAVASPAIALSRYHAGYSLAESLYAASRFVGWEDVIIGDPLCTPYAGKGGLVTPHYITAIAASTGGAQSESCTEGGQDLSKINAGSSTTYSAVSLANPTTFVARVASAGAGGTIEVHLDNAATASATCQVSPTGNWQTWVTVTCAFTGTSGVHDISLLYSGTGGGALFSAEWFAFR